MDKKYRDSACCFSDILAELMSDWRVESADIFHATGIPYSTLTGYIKNHVKAPLLNRNILSLAQYFHCSIDFLVFGIGPEPAEEHAVLARKARDARRKEVLNRQQIQINKQYSEK